MKCVTHNLKEMQKLAGDFVADLKPSIKGATIVGLYGELGAGKTSFTQGVAKALGIYETVVSPTFVIMKKYKIVAKENSVAEGVLLQEMQKYAFCNLIHIDAYRLEKSQELLHLGWSEIIANQENLILIEWPERVADIMADHIHVNFTHVSENIREVEIL